MPNETRLTDEQIEKLSGPIWDELGEEPYDPWLSSETVLAFARAIEQAATRAALERAAVACNEVFDFAEATDVDMKRVGQRYRWIVDCCIEAIRNLITKGE
jgi:hypothetical protein